MGEERTEGEFEGEGERGDGWQVVEILPSFIDPAAEMMSRKGKGKQGGLYLGRMFGSQGSAVIPVT